MSKCGGRWAPDLREFFVSSAALASWSAVAERSGDTALAWGRNRRGHAGSALSKSGYAARESAVAATLCRRTPNGWPAHRQALPYFRTISTGLNAVTACFTL